MENLEKDLKAIKADIKRQMDLNTNRELDLVLEQNHALACLAERLLEHVKLEAYSTGKRLSSLEEYHN